MTEKLEEVFKQEVISREETLITKDTDVEAVVNQTLNPKRLQVVPNWKSVFFTWSFHFHMLSVILTFVEQLLPFLGFLEPTMSVQTYGILMFVFNGLGLASRFIKQRNLWKYPVEEKKHE